MRILFAFAAALTAACGTPSSGPTTPDSGLSSVDASPRDDGASTDGPHAGDGATSSDGARMADAGPARDGGSVTGDPSGDGPHGVKQTDTTAGGVAVTVFAPSDDGGAHIATAGAPYPLIVISPGFQMPRAQYASYARRLATWGFIAVTQDFSGGFSPDHAAYARQTTTLIDWALGSTSGLAGSLEAAEIGTAGHSMGGKISLLAAESDHRISAVVAWDPVDSNSPAAAPSTGMIQGAVAVLGETTDAAGGFMPCAPAADNFTHYYAAAHAPALQVQVTAADHMDFVDDPSCTLCGFCTAGTASDAAVKAVTRRTTVAWFRRYLAGDTAMDAWLTGAGMQADVSAGTVTVTAK